MQDVATAWKPLGSIPPQRLVEARHQLHHLVQLVASFGEALVAPRDDDSHRSMTWDPEAGGFRSPDANRGDGLHLVVTPLPLQVQIRHGQEEVSYVLPGHTLGEAYAWAERELGLLIGEDGFTLPRPEFEIPRHRVDQGALFDASPMALEELGRWYHDAHLLLSELDVPAGVEASPVRCWPHHFDMAVLFTLPGEGEPRTVGAGVSPGDDDPEPYWYVRPWPEPRSAACPELPEGEWISDGWFGAVLPAARLLQGDREQQSERVHTFLRAGVDACLELLQD